MVLDVTTKQQQGDIYVDYDYEEVMFRWDHIKKLSTVNFMVKILKWQCLLIIAYIVMR